MRGCQGLHGSPRCVQLLLLLRAACQRWNDCSLKALLLLVVPLLNLLLLKWGSDSLLLIRLLLQTWLSLKAYTHALQVRVIYGTVASPYKVFLCLHGCRGSHSLIIASPLRGQRRWNKNLLFLFACGASILLF